jgi:hypothetical protein
MRGSPAFLYQVFHVPSCQKLRLGQNSGTNLLAWTRVYDALFANCFFESFLQQTALIMSPLGKCLS